MDTPTRGHDAQEEIDLRVIVARLRARRWWLLTSIVVFTAAFAAAAFLMTPIYRATTIMVPASADRSSMGGLGAALGQLGGIASLAGLSLGNNDSQTEEALAVLQSREFTETFINRAHVMPELYSDRWDATRQQFRGPQEKWPTLAQAAKFFDKNVRTVNKDKMTGLIRMDIEWRDRFKAAEWANALVKQLNDEMRTRAIASTNASVEYLNKELASTSAVETRQAINRLMEAQINRRMLANVTEEYVLRVVDRALPSDPHDKVKPQKLLLLVLGPTIGLLFGAFVVLVAGALAKPAGPV